MLLYGIVWVIARILISICIRCEVRGRENIPHRGAVIVVANHIHNIDAPLLGFWLGRRASYISKEELFTNAVLAFFLKQLGAFPAHRGRLNLDTFKKTYKILAEERVVVVFPEGTRSLNARLNSAYDGPTLIALRSQAMILPVGISGSEVVKGWGWIWRRPRISISFGQPFRLPPADGRMKKEQLGEYTGLIMHKVAGLLPPAYRGIYNRAEEQHGAGD